jgi:hypothetical protein
MKKYKKVTYLMDTKIYSELNDKFRGQFLGIYTSLRFRMIQTDRRFQDVYWTLLNKILDQLED